MPTKLHASGQEPTSYKKELKTYLGGSKMLIEFMHQANDITGAVTEVHEGRGRVLAHCMHAVAVLWDKKWNQEFLRK